jgi:hypothetical protein
MDDIIGTSVTTELGQLGLYSTGSLCIYMNETISFSRRVHFNIHVNKVLCAAVTAMPFINATL